MLSVRRVSGVANEVAVVCRVDTTEEITYYHHGGILPYINRELVGQIANESSPAVH